MESVEGNGGKRKRGKEWEEKVGKERRGVRLHIVSRGPQVPSYDTIRPPVNHTIVYHRTLYTQDATLHAIAKTTARCPQYMSALKIVCKHKSSRRLRKNLHITILYHYRILSLSAVKLFSKYSNKCDHGT